MFHRVKSETQDTAAQAEEVVAVENEEEISAAQEQESEAQEAQESSVQVELAEDDSDDAEEQAQSSGAPAYSAPKQSAPTYRTAPYASSASSYGAAAAAVARPAAAPVATAGSAVSSSSVDMDRRLTIGRGITMSGEIESCDYLEVEGTVEAALKGAQVLDIAESGTFYGTVEIQDAVIAGRFEGDIAAHGRLSVTSTGVVTGTISYKELAIEAGAVIDGRLTPIGSMPAASVQPSPVKKPASKVQRQATPGPANADGELFSEAKVSAAE